MRLRTNFVFLLGASLLLASTAHAQRLTGSIQGTVSDETGAVLPGVIVEASSEALIAGKLTTSTDEKGRYRFPTLRPGSYTLTFNLPGFTVVTRPNLRVTVGATISENIDLTLATVEQTLTVTGEAPLIDTTSTEVTTNYTQEFLENTPVSRFTFFDLLQSAPGVSQSSFDNTASRSMAYGSNGNENMYQLDGTDLTAPLTGAAWPWPNTDVIEEIEIIGLGAPAEYGNMQGAVFNVVTKSGGNEFHGDANFFYQSDALTGTNTTIPLERPDGTVVDQGFNRDQYVDATFQIGGPVMRDKVWFFAGLQARREHFSEPGTPPEFPKEEDDNRIFFKVSAQLSENNTLVGQLHNDYYTIPRTISFTVPPESSFAEKGSNPTPNVTWTSIVSDKLFYEVRYAGFYGNDRNDFISGDYNTPGHYDAYGYYSVNPIYWYDGTIWKSQFNGKVSMFADDFLHGDHDFKFGVQYNQGGENYAGGYTGGAYLYDYGGAPYIAYYQVPFHYGGEETSLGLFIDDSWSFNDRLTLNLGVRFDHSTGTSPDYAELVLDPNGERGVSETGNDIPGRGEIVNWTTVSPRLGASIKLDQEGRTLLRLHYGRYYQALLTGPLEFLANSTNPITGAFFNPETGLYDDVFFFNDPPLQRGIDPELKNPYTDQYTLGIDHQLSDTIALGVTYVYKWSQDFNGRLDIGGSYEPVTVFDPVSNRDVVVLNRTSDPEESFFQLTNPPGFYQKYSGLVLTVNKRLSHNWQGLASLTLSRSEGLHAGSGRGTNQSQDSRAGTFGQDPNDFINADALLNADRKYMFKSQLSYQFPYDFLASANWNVLQGTPYAPFFRAGLDQGSRRVFSFPRSNDLRTPTVNLLDIRLSKTFQFADNANLVGLIEVFNLLNNDAFYDIGSTIGTSSAFGVGALFVQPRRAQLGVKFLF
ncbi:MAG TPA: TonB-dependent receptor [Acidobacteriota bacterium]